MRFILRCGSACVVAAALSLAACSENDQDTADAPADAATTPAVAPEDTPSRAMERARDVGSKPQEVMDFLGVSEGDRVADILAGSGYYTYLLSERVGTRGRVYAQGYRPGLQARVEAGDLAPSDNVTLVDSLAALPENTLDAILIIRGFHLLEAESALPALYQALKPGGVVGVVEVRLGQEYGHDMETHRMGEQTVIDSFREAGFDFSATSTILRNPDDDHTEFWEGRRHLTDRMLLKFARPGEPAPATPPTASVDR